MRIRVGRKLLAVAKIGRDTQRGAQAVNRVLGTKKTGKGAK